MMELKNINFSYSNNKEILKDFSLKVERGEFYSILGLNGAGKSTLLKIMAGYLKMPNDCVKIADKNIADFSVKELAKIRSVLEQESQLSFNYTVEEVVQLALFAQNSNINFIEEIMQDCELLELRNRLYTELSGGEKQRVCLARAILQIYAEDMSGKILFLDEPSASLDPLHTNLIMRLAKKLQGRKCTIVSILHDPNLAYLYSTKIIGISDAKLAFELSPKDFMQEEVLSNLYKCPCQVISNGDKSLVIFN